MKHIELNITKNNQSHELNTDIREVLDCAAEQGKKNVKEFSGIYKHLGLNWKNYFHNRKLFPEKLIQDLSEKNIPPHQQKQFLCRMIHCVMDDSNGSLEELLIAAFD